MTSFLRYSALRLPLLCIPLLLSLGCSDKKDSSGGQSGIGGSTSVGDKGSDQRPQFDGVSSAQLIDGRVVLHWDHPATDKETPSERIVYRGYVGPASGLVDYTNPVGISVAGADQLLISGAMPSTAALQFAVRAVDTAGNEDGGKKTVELELGGGQVPQFAGAVTATALSKSSIEVSWEAPQAGAGVDHYLVYLTDADGYPQSTEPKVVPAGTLNYTFIGLNEFSTYRVAVQAIDESGRSDGNRRYLEVTTLDETPPTFFGIESAVAGGTSVLITWGEASDNVTPSAAIIYRVFAGSTSSNIDFDTPVSEVTGIGHVTLRDQGVSLARSYAVRAFDAAGNVAIPGNFINLTTGATTDSTSPTFDGVQAVSPLSSHSLLVSWNAASDDITPTNSIVYELWVSPDPVFPSSQPSTYESAPGATSFEVDGLNSATFYNVVVRARDIEGYRDLNTKTLTVATKTDDDPPVFAGITSVTGLSATEIRVEWKSAIDGFPSSELTYDVYVASSSGAQNFAIPTTSVVGATSTTISGLIRNKNYYVVVRVRDPDGNLNDDDIEAVGATLPDTTPPVLDSAPSLLASETSISASWSAATDDSYPSNQLLYRVEYRLNGVKAWTVSKAFTQNLLNWTINGLSTNTKYDVRVTPADGSGNLGVGVIATVTTSSDTTAPVWANTTTTLSATSSSLYNFVTVSWGVVHDNVTADANISFELCYSTSSTGCNTFSSYVTVSAGSTSRVVNFLPLGQRYYFRVRAVDEAGNRTALTQVTDTTPPIAANFGPTAHEKTSGGTLLNATVGIASDAVFAQVRYRLEYLDYSWNGASCVGTWTTSATSTPTASTTTVSYPKRFSSNQSRVFAIDGFGNEQQSSLASLIFSDSTATAANEILVPLWTANCNTGGCHDGSSVYYPNWNMTTVFQNPAPLGGSPAVIVPGSLANSRMYQRTIGVGGYMPSGWLEPLDVMVCNLSPWIAAGAPH